MKKIALLTCFLGIALGSNAHAANCYVFQNKGVQAVKLTFVYNRPPTATPIPGPTSITLPNTGMPMEATVAANGKYPASGQSWCWAASDNSQAVVGIGRAGRASWSGPLVLGNGKNAAPSGTYVVNSTGGVVDVDAKVKAMVAAQPAAATKPQMPVVPALNSPSTTPKSIAGTSTAAPTWQPVTPVVH